ncbi:MAG: NADH-quinone oxidoreductase subunit A [Candidatus Bipolaricaulia bacterium]
MTSEFSPILVYMLIAAGITAFVVSSNKLLSFRRPSTNKEAPYESGIRPLGDARGRLRISFYLIAMTFLVFDLEIAFVYPWAVVYQNFGWGGFTAMSLFLMIIFVGYIYEWKRGALDWQ